VAEAPSPPPARRTTSPKSLQWHPCSYTPNPYSYTSDLAVSVTIPAYFQAGQQDRLRTSRVGFLHLLAGSGWLSSVDLLDFVELFEEVGSILR
jgi:hypothetical protein